jgi:hypothetical protein
VLDELELGLPLPPNLRRHNVGGTRTNLRERHSGRVRKWGGGVWTRHLGRKR